MAPRATPPLVLRAESGAWLTPEDVADRVENMIPSQDGSLRTCWGPAPLISENDGSPYLMPGPVHGLCHAVLKGGQQETILVQAGNRILRFRGWTRDFETLIGPFSSSPRITASLPSDTKPRSPAQFIQVPNGVVILPKGDTRAYFFDGENIAPLGFDSPPGAPLALGPTSSAPSENQTDSSDKPGLNDAGFAHDAQGFATTASNPSFGVGRLGTVSPVFGALSGKVTSSHNDSYTTITAQLLQGQYQYAVQFVDAWGNLSQISGRSNVLQLAQQNARFWWGDPGSEEWRAGRGEQVQKHGALTQIDTGPTHCVGRILYRSRDLLNSGTASLFEIPLNAAGGAFAFATLPDNESRFFPDNVADSYLVTEPEEYVSVANFSYGALWDGRLWTGGYASDPGMVRYSERGLWGTFTRKGTFFPDGRGRGITGFGVVAPGLLIFSETSTFLIQRAVDSLDGYRTQQVSASIGCAAPDSIRALGDGSLVWAARDGFYRFDGQSLEKISKDIDYQWRFVTLGRLIQATALYEPKTREYRCWLSVEGSDENNTCYIWDGKGWRERNGEPAQAAAIAQSPRAYPMWGGRDVAAEGDPVYAIWIMDHEVWSYSPAPRAGVIETAWINALDSQTRVSPRYAELWLQETGDRTLTVSVFKNYRYVVDQQVTATSKEQPPVTYPTDNAPPFWGDATWQAGTVTSATAPRWSRRRPFWRRVSIALQSVESFKIRISGTAGEPWAFVAIRLVFDVKDPGSNGRMPP